MAAAGSCSFQELHSKPGKGPAAPCSAGTQGLWSVCAGSSGCSGLIRAPTCDRRIQSWAAHPQKGDRPQVGLHELGGVFQPKRSWDAVKRPSDGLWNVLPKQPEWTCLRGSRGSWGSGGVGRSISKLSQLSLKLWDQATDLDVSSSSAGRQSTAVALLAYLKDLAASCN